MPENVVPAHVVPGHVVIVGAGLGGVRTLEQLRSAGYTGAITLIGAEEHPPYDRPPLSKQVLSGAWEPGRVVLRDKPGLDELDVTHRLGAAAVGLNGTTVELADGTSVTGDAVVIATGVTPRRIPGQPIGVWTLRTLDDATALRDALGDSRSLLVIGGGFIGAEVAHAARVRGLDVTVVEALAVPCERALGREVGVLAGRLFTDAGVDLRCNTHLTRFIDAHTVALSDGSTVSADVVLVGIGATPDLGWLAGSGLVPADGQPGDGLACGPTGRVTGAPNVWALGDMAAWWDAERGRHHRAEHWTTTIDQAAVVARNLLGDELLSPSVPYVWSDQFNLKIQLVGRPDLADEVLPLVGEGLEGGPVKGTVVGYLADDRLVAVAGFGAPRFLPRLRGLVATSAHRTTVLSLTQELIGGVVR
jgi:NADPH-dependent 2,4-dienoyl-CoA reductase/sulfur reductase-like enzyme